MDRSLFFSVNIAILLLVVPHGSADPAPCCWPPQLEAVFDSKYGIYIKSSNQVLLQDAHVITHVDYGRQMIVNELAILNSNVSSFETQIIDYKKQVIYTISNNNCQRDGFPYPMGENCVPENANYLGERDILGVPADVWFVSTMNGTSNVTTERLTVARENCYLLQSIGLTIGDTSYLSMATSQNVTAGIANPSVFNIPPFCNQTGIHQERPYRTFFHTWNFLKSG